MMTKSKSNLLAQRPLLVVTSEYFQSITAVAMVMRNLLNWFDPQDYIVVCGRALNPVSHENQRQGERVHLLGFHIKFSSRLDQYWQIFMMQSRLPALKLLSLIRKYRCGAVLAVYPTSGYVAAGMDAARMAGIPFAAYLHDTMAEGTAGTIEAAYASRVQFRLFRDNHAVFCMNEGLAQLLQSKYHTNAVPLCHTYNEPIVASPWRKIRQHPTVLFSGSIYSINLKAVIRTSKAAIASGFRITCTLRSAADTLVKAGLPSESIDVDFRSTRKGYLNVLRENDVCLIALSWPDESSIHRDELATIFPTKAPEYLASGRPVLIHAPEDYFVSRFFSERNCGVVTTSRNEEALIALWKRMREDDDWAKSTSERGLEAARYFEGSKVAQKFRDQIVEIVERRNFLYNR